MGGTQEVHDRERALIRRLAFELLSRIHDDDGGLIIEDPAEVEWGAMEFHTQVEHATVLVRLSVQP